MLRCALNDCQVEKDGRCLEGRGEACPHLLPDSGEPKAIIEPQDVGPASESVPTAFEPLSKRVPLELDEARSFAQRGPCTVVALVGMPECGKTSLLARLHQLFQAGPIAGFEFAGSNSLPYFEELNWLATMESGGIGIPAMKRSSAIFDNSFLHLAVRSMANGTRMEILLNDIIGETFEKAIASQTECDKLIALARADHLVVVVDGEALATHTLRNYQLDQARDFVQRVLQRGQCGARTALHIVISKLDKLKGHEGVADRMEEEFEARLRSTMGSVHFWRIAARPMDGSLPTTDDIGRLFASWVETTHRYPTRALSVLPRDAWKRDFCRFGI